MCVCLSVRACVCQKETERKREGLFSDLYMHYHDLRLVQAAAQIPFLKPDGSLRV